MIRENVISLMGLIFLVSACGSTDTSPPPTLQGVDGGTMELSADALHAFMVSKAYVDWPAEPAVHPSTGPHGGNVRTYMNQTMFDALKAGATEFPNGSIVVKEQYGADTETIEGWSLDAKGDDGRWVFIETYGPPFGKPYYFRGVDNLCGNCHRTGIDYLLTPPGSF